MLTTLLAVLAFRAAAIGAPAPAPREFRGVWVATVDHIDWPPRDVLDPVKQRQYLIDILDRAQQLHLNAVVFQVRPMGDAFYASSREPWSEFLTGAQGRAPSPYWDPLQFAVWEAHLRGLELHAWFNPFRVWHPAAKGAAASNYLGYTHPDWVKKYGQFKWLDPGEENVRHWVIDTVLDVVRRYDIDGVQIDDYFYPYPVRSEGREEPFPDDKAWNVYIASGGRLGRADWRRQNVDEFVQGLYKGIKAVKPWVKFGISPFGIYRPGIPSGIKGGVDQVADLYADPLRWLEAGWCDYLSPQLYWQIKSPAQSYPVLAKWWSEHNPLHRHLWFGNYASQLLSSWPADEIVNQIGVTRKTHGADGNILYSMSPLMRDAKGIDQKLLAGPYEGDALVPACNWLKSQAPGRPELHVTGLRSGKLLTMRRTTVDAWQWILYSHRNGEWRFDRVLSADQGALLIDDKTFGAHVDAVAVSALDRYGNESDRVVAAL